MLLAYDKNQATLEAEIRAGEIFGRSNRSSISLGELRVL
jgi:hypothetical protein